MIYVNSHILFLAYNLLARLKLGLYVEVRKELCFATQFPSFFLHILNSSYLNAHVI